MTRYYDALQKTEKRQACERQKNCVHLTTRVTITQYMQHMYNVMHAVRYYTYLSDSTARQGWIITHDNPIEDVYSVVWYYNALHVLLFTKDICFYQRTYIFIIRMQYMHVCDRETRRAHARMHLTTRRPRVQQTRLT